MNFATVGTSAITGEFISAAKGTGRYNLLAVYSRDINKAKEFGDMHGSLSYYDDIGKLLLKELDVVYIATPNSLHYEQADFFLRNGKHVICEKPLVSKKGQLEALYETAKENGVYLFEALRHIHTPGFTVIKEKLSEIAPVRNVVLSFNQYSSRYDAFKLGDIKNIFSTELDGGAKFDIGVYPISFCAALFGMPKSFCRRSILLSNGVDGAGWYLLDYGEFVCGISYSKIADDIIQNEIIGEKGGIRFNKFTNLDSIELCMRNADAVNVSPNQEYYNMCYEADNFADIIESNDMESYNRLIEISSVTNKLLLGEGYK